MPHLIVELSQGFEPSIEKGLLTKLNEGLFRSGEFTHSRDIKSRIHRADNSLIGLSADDGELFVVAHLMIMSGRDDATKRSLVQSVLDTLVAHFTGQYDTVQFAVNLQELSPFYQKITV
ncbi:hypothetical protein LU293_03585 [Moraxella nasovis]|uniref:5-carboxymethyl-2-hydroxymuconate Delta-isomerase n=1 Tax=Moraxella nasovis TaxID=2904121 RepID=UPI001F60B1D4|nr:hypothetical protein [Moraxella nasovis]UNU73985.1 hypothetical protein LU293_03585 [Moraxella nasovis]